MRETIIEFHAYLFKIISYLCKCHKKGWCQMKGEVVGCYVKKCKPDKKWESSACVCLKQDMPTDVLFSAGSIYKSFTCEGKLLPLQPSDLVGRVISVSQNNGFVDDIFLRE